MRADNHKTMIFIFGIFLGFGVLFLTIGIMFAVFMGGDNKEDYIERTATIDRIERYNDNHHVYISYEIDGVEYNDVRYNYYSSGMREGKQISVLVNKYDPTQFYVGNFALIFGLSFGGFGLLFGVIGAIPIIKTMRIVKEEKRIKSLGNSIWGVINGVKMDYTVSVNKRHPYKLNIKYEDDGIVTVAHDYKSDAVWIDGDPMEYVGKQIRIYIDPQNTSKYVVDVESVM